MKVLVTGSSGRVGRAVVAALGPENVIAFDSSDGDDVLDRSAIRVAVEGCDAVVHLASIIDDGLRSPTETIGQNVAGLWSVLDAAIDAGVRRFVFMSSVQALGVTQSYRDPDYLPIDDDHPSYAIAPYGLSKLLGERACEVASRLSGITTLCLRAPNVLAPNEYAGWQQRRARLSELEDPAWNYGSWIDVRDLAAAVKAGLGASITGHHTLLVCADDIASNRPGRDVIDELYPEVLRGDELPGAFDSWIDSSQARRLLGWAPHHRWQEWVALQQGVAQDADAMHSRTVDMTGGKLS